MTFVSFKKDGEVQTWFEHVGGGYYRCHWCLKDGSSSGSPNKLLDVKAAARAGLLREDFDECPDELAVLLAKRALLGDLTN